MIAKGPRGAWRLVVGCAPAGPPDHRLHRSSNPSLAPQAPRYFWDHPFL